MSPTSTVLIADDHPLFRTALRGALGSMLPGAVVHEADSFPALKAAVAAHPDLDLILLDLDMPGVRGFASLLWLRGEHPSVPIVIVSGQAQPALMRRAMDFGASGFIPKSVEPAVMAQGVRAVLAGGMWVPPEITQTDAQDEEQARARRIASLTPQQFRVLMMVADGLLNKQIAHEIDVTEATVKVHIAAIMRKLGLFRRTQLAVLAQRLLLAEHASLRIDSGADEGRRADEH